MVDRIECIHFEHVIVDVDGNRIKVPSCRIGKMRGLNGCDNYCEWFEPKEPNIPNPPIFPDEPEPLNPY